MKPPCYAAVVASVCLWLQASVAHSQNSILADPIQTHVSGFWDTTVFATPPRHFVLGHQWAAAKHDKTNTRLRANLTNHNWGYTAVPELMAQLTRLGAGVGDTNYLCWGEVAINDHGAGMSDYATDDSDALARAAFGTTHIVDLAARRNISTADETSLLVFSNPAAASVNIAIVGTTMATPYSIIDAAGHVVHAGTIMNGNIATIEGLPTGVYAVRAGIVAVHGRTAVRQTTVVVMR